ncbi:NRDE family protein [Ancylomarina sp. 16SWW S1-10-2]|uniref:NRDE family protein n=1 Tax=Ancylomarina sp. 16SWW S1-10-2 TaxID=2499681 RepID=UPI0012ADF10B|nr:NRDE family protein [Ancylomarina sp. 16SWW S1-10-2]MRT94103.1 hypothetical protein [Ancylomarina sp. 16SWW S1-10-2]
MCTLSFIPVSDNDFIFTMNRDEDPNRIALEPQKYVHNGLELYYPRDSKANGSWIISNGINTSLCLLNGAFKKHKRRSDYRQSRGLMLLEFFEYSNPTDFIDNYQFEGMEAFTLVIVQGGSKICLWQLVWDEQNLHVKKLPASKSYIWSSATLYSDSMKYEREQWFRDWLRNEKEINQASSLNFHKTGGKGNLEYGLLMNRKNRVRTLSITQISGNGNVHKMTYHNLLDEDKQIR